MKSLKKYIVPILIAVVIAVFLYLGFDGLKELQDLNPDYTFWDNVVANFNDTLWIKVLAYLILALGSSTVLGQYLKTLISKR